MVRSQPDPVAVYFLSRMWLAEATLSGRGIYHYVIGINLGSRCLCPVCQLALLSAGPGRINHS